MKIKSFECDNNLSKYVDSMLFDSGAVIATLNYDNEELGENEVHDISVSLEVAGKVKVIYKDSTYTEPSEFPEELREKIRSTEFWDVYAPDDENEGDIYVDFNNWFELIYTIDGSYTDRIMFEEDISKYTPEKLKLKIIEIMQKICEED